jgi:hypothetical protein
MSRQLISSEKFPTKPHNCKFLHGYWRKSTELIIHVPGPAVKVPGLVFCAGQTATGEIRAATVRLSSFPCPTDLLFR